MKANIGNIDRGVRLVIGFVALLAVFVGPLASGSWEPILAAIVAVIMIGTSTIKFCPLYRIFGMRTCKVD